MLLRRVGLFVVAFGLSLHADSLSFTNFQVLNVPNSVTPGSAKINDKGDLIASGLLLPANSTTPISINYPSGVYTAVTGLNNSDELVGFSLIAGRPGVIDGFTFSNGNFSPVRAGGNETFVNAINNNGDIGGDYSLGSAGGTGFLIVRGALTTFSVPSASPGTYVTGLNDANEAVGYYNNGGVLSGFVRAPNGTIATFVYSATNPDIVPEAINNNGIIVGSYGRPETDTSSGMARLGQTNYSFDAPGAAYTFLTGINNSNRAIGYTIDPGNGNRLFSVDIVVNPVPEPASVYMGSVGLFCLAAVQYRRRSQRRAALTSESLPEPAGPFLKTRLRSDTEASSRS